MKEIQIDSKMWPDVFKLNQCRAQLNEVSKMYTELMKMMGIPLSANFEIHPDKGKIFYKERENSPATETPS